MRFVLNRLSVKRRTGADEEAEADFEHLDPEFVPKPPQLTPPLPRRGTPSMTRAESFQRFERTLIYMQHEA
jgi:hypothetical protein